MSEGKVVGQGGFKLDRARALEKLAAYQLEDPRRYVLELVAAGIRAGSLGMEIRCTASELELCWDGVHPTREDLEGIFDWIFTESREDRPAMLQHLAQGLLGALGLKPRRLLLERPGLTVDLTNPADFLEMPNSRQSGVLVRVEERFSWAMIKEWFGTRAEGYESQILKKEARYAPIPILHNGQPLSQPLRPPISQPVYQEPGKQLWLGGEEAVVVLVRDGIRVEDLELKLGSKLGLAGIVTVELPLNASRSQFLRDKGLESLRASLSNHMASLLVQSVEGMEPRLVSESYLEAIGQLLFNKHPEPALETLAILPDLRGRFWSAKALGALPAIILHPKDTPYQHGLPDPQFAIGSFPAELVLKRWPEAREAGAKLLASYLVGVQQRALKVAGPPRFVSSAKKTVSHPKIQGEVALLGTGFTLTWLVDGLQVEKEVLTGLGPAHAWVEHDDMEAELDWSRVKRNPAYQEALQLVLESLEQLLIEQLSQHLLSHLESDLLSAATHTALNQSKPPERILEAARLPRLAAEPISLKTALSYKTLYYIDPTIVVPPEFLEPIKTVIRLPYGWDRWLKKHVTLHNIGPDLQDDIAASRARARSPLTPHPPANVSMPVLVELPGLSGFLGLLMEGRAEVLVLKEGVSLGSYPWSLDFAAAQVQWQDANPIRAWDKLAEPTQVEELASRLMPLAKELLIKACNALEPAGPLPLWLLVAGRREGLLIDDLPLFQTLKGDVKSLAQLPENVPFTLKRPLKIAPGLESMLIVDEGRAQLLNIRRKARENTAYIEACSQAFSQFQNQPKQQKLQGPCRQEGLIDGFQVEAVLGEPTATGLSIRVLYQQRQLCSSWAPFPVPILVQLSGEAIVPSSRLDGLATGLQSAIRAAALQLGIQLLKTLPKADLLPSQRGKLWLGLRQGAGDVPAVLRDELAAQLWEKELFTDLRGLVLTGPQLAKREVYLLSGQESPGQLPDSHPLVEAAWLKADRELEEALKEVLSQEPEPGDRILGEALTGVARITALPIEPFIPREKVLESLYVERQGASIWVGLTEEADCGLEWFIKDRAFAGANRSLPVPLWTRIKHPELQLNHSASGPVLSPLVEKLLKLAGEVESEFIKSLAQKKLAVFRPVIFKWMAARKQGNFTGIPLAYDLQGGSHDFFSLQAMVAKGGIRVAEPGTPLVRSKKRVILSADAALKADLALLGEVVDVTAELKADAEAEVRAKAVGALPEPDKDALEVVQVPDRSGFLQLLASGSAEVCLYHKGRSLGTVSLDSPFPISGHIEDNTLSPDRSFSKAVSNKAFKGLKQTLDGLAMGMGVRALKKPLPRALYLKALLRAFSSVKELKAIRPAAEDPKSRLALLPMFATSSGLKSAQELLKLREIRWVQQLRPCLDERMPFVVATLEEQAILIPFLGGRSAEEEASQEEAVVEAKAQGPKLPERNWILERSIEIFGVKGVLGVDLKLATGIVELGTGAVAIARDELPALPGVQVVLAPIPGIRGGLGKDRLKELSRVVGTILVETGNFELRKAVGEKWGGEEIPGVWADFPLIEGISGFVSFSEARKHAWQGSLLFQHKPVPNKLVLIDTPLNRRLLLPMQALLLNAEAQAAKEAAKEKKRKEDAAWFRTRECIQALSHDLKIKLSREQVAASLYWGEAVEEPEGLAPWAVAFERLETQANPEQSMKIGLRLAQKLVGLRSGA